MEENMIKVLINGCNGKMGQEVAKSIERNDNFETICGVDRLDTGDNKFPVYTNINQIRTRYNNRLLYPSSNIYNIRICCTKTHTSCNSNYRLFR